MRRNPLDDFDHASAKNSMTALTLPASSVVENTATEPNSGVIASLIETSRRWLRSGWVATGAGITVGLLASLLLIAGLLDLILVLWPSFRLIALMAVLIPTLLALAWGVLRPLFRRITRRAVARRIEAQLPGIHNRLVSCVDLESSAQAKSVSASFYKKLLSEAIARIQGFQPQKLLDRNHLQRAAIFAGTSVLSFVVGMQVFSDRLPTALARIFSPFADIPPASGVVYSVEPGDQKVLRGNEVAFTVTVEKGTPDDLTLEIDVTEGDEKGKSLRYDLVSQSEAVWTFRLPGFSSSFDYRVRGGGTWSPLYHVTMLDRPQIVGLRTKLTYPSYMGAIPPEIGLPDVADVIGPVDGNVDVEVQVDGDPTVGRIELLQSRVRSMPIVHRPERTWIATQIPDAALPEGTWEWLPDHQGRVAHRHAAAEGLTFHQFVNAPVGFRVKPGEVLFADVFLDREQPPLAIMLQYHDGLSWEHRAFWGKDVFTMGQLETVNRFNAGELPEMGKWVRLEIPASLLGLEGHSLHGVSFSQFGGSTWWGNAGTVPPSVKQVDELVVTETIPMQFAGPVGDASPTNSKDSTANKPLQLWSGTFPLRQDGWYRVELRNELGAPNPRMKEAKLTAIPDRPPQVVVERPGVDLILSAPQKIPLSIAAFDDFGLADLVLAVQVGETGGFHGRPVKHYESLQKADTTIVVLDLVVEKLKEGDVLKYRVEARDRKGQSAQTQDFIIRIKQDPQAADQQLANVEKNEENFRQQLAKLITDQAAVQQEMEKLEAKYEPLSEKLEAAAKEAQKQAEQAALQQAKENPPAEKPPMPEPPTLDEPTKQQLAEMKSELASINQREQQNVQAAQQLENAAKAIAQELNQQQLVPPELQQEMQRVADSFHDLAVQPLTDLHAQLQENTKPDKTNPQLAQLTEQGETVARNLDALQDRMDAIAAAQQQSKDDIQAAMEQFQRELTRQNAQLSADELAGLKEKIAEMRAAMQDLLQDQEELMEITPDVPDLLVEDVAEKQDDLDVEIDDSLADAQQLLNTEEYRKLKQQQQDADAADESEDPEMSPDEQTKPTDKQNDEPMFQPALGGPKPQVDPKFTEKPMPASKGKSKNDPPPSEEKPESEAQAAAAMRMELGRQQRRQAKALSEAEQSLGSDELTIDGLLRELERQLTKAMQQAETAEASAQEPADAASPPETEAPATEMEIPLDELLPKLTAEQAQQLAAMLKSQTMKQAMAMAERGRRTERKQQQKSQQPPTASEPQPSENPVGNLLGTLPGEQMLRIELLNLDPASRKVILNMQPSQREEILQGLREDGPEGYREYIRDYFEQLTKVKAGSP